MENTPQSTPSTRGSSSRSSGSAPQGSEAQGSSTASSPDRPEKRFEDILQNYSAGLQQLLQDHYQRWHDAQRNYLQSVYDAWAKDDTEKRIQEAQRNWVQAWQAAVADAQKRSEEIYRAQVRALQDAWAKADPGALGVNSLASIGWVTTVLAHYGAYTVNPS